MPFVPFHQVHEQYVVAVRPVLAPSFSCSLLQGLVLGVLGDALGLAGSLLPGLVVSIRIQALLGCRFGKVQCFSGLFQRLLLGFALQLQPIADSSCDTGIRASSSASADSRAFSAATTCRSTASIPESVLPLAIMSTRKPASSR